MLRTSDHVTVLDALSPDRGHPLPLYADGDAFLQDVYELVHAAAEALRLAQTPGDAYQCLLALLGAVLVKLTRAQLLVRQSHEVATRLSDAGLDNKLREMRGLTYGLVLLARRWPSETERS